MIFEDYYKNIKTVVPSNAIIYFSIEYTLFSTIFQITVNWGQNHFFKEFYYN